VRRTARRFFPVRTKCQHMPQRGFEVAAETDGAVIDEHMRRRFAARHRRYVPEKPMFPQPTPRTDRVPRRKHHDVKTVLGQRPQKDVSARLRRVPVRRVFPTLVAVEHAVEIDADDRHSRMVEVASSQPRCSRRHVADVITHRGTRLAPR
jgi:hypothetical protein